MTEPALELVPEVKRVKLDLGCGTRKYTGPDGKEDDWIGVDCIQFEGVDLVVNLGRDKWPWDDNSVDEVYSCHMVEHLAATERIHFVNELWRVLRMEGKCQIIVPVWSSCRAYGDLTHQWPPVSEFWFFYLKRLWRLGDPKAKGPESMANAPHNDVKYWDKGYSCDFEVTWGHSLHPALVSRNDEYKMNAVQFWKDATMDIIATLVKHDRKP